MSDLFLGAILGALAMCAAAMAGSKLGVISIVRGRQKDAEPAPSASRVYPHLGCSITVEDKNELASGLKPQVRLFATVENDGDLMVRSLKGFWRIVTPDKQKHAPIRMQRDSLGPKEKYLESYMLDEGLDTHGEGIKFDVEVDFNYIAQAESRHFSGKYRYDRKNFRMIKL